MGQGGLGCPQSSLQLCFGQSCSVGLDPESQTPLCCEQGCSQAVWSQLLGSPQCTLILTANPCAGLSVVCL